LAALGLAVLWYVPARLSTASPLQFVMGSALAQTYWGPARKAPAAAVGAAISALETQLSAAAAPPPLAQDFYKASGGAFDPWLGALVKLWNIDGKHGAPPRVPAPEEIAKALQTRALDLGAYGKGAACDAALDIIQTSGVKAAVVNLGGNILTFGRKPWNQPFRIALRDPKAGPGQTLGLFQLRGTRFLSTSGSYEKFFEQDGKRYHHIFDPKTGCPAQTNGLVSVTVINSQGALGDMLSTACFVLGYQKSQPLLLRYHADALFVYENNGVRAAGNVRQYVQLESSYHWSSP
jgi:thiamine biosynthesis lipoprotein